MGKYPLNNPGHNKFKILSKRKSFDYLILSVCVVVNTHLSRNLAYGTLKENG